MKKHEMLTQNEFYALCRRIGQSATNQLGGLDDPKAADAFLLLYYLVQKGTLTLQDEDKYVIDVLKEDVSLTEWRDALPQLSE